MIIYEIVIEEKVRERKDNYKIGVDINKKDWTKTRITLRNDENDGRKKKYLEVWSLMKSLQEEKVRERNNKCKIGVSINKKDWMRTRIALRKKRQENERKWKKIPIDVITYKIIRQRKKSGFVDSL